MRFALVIVLLVGTAFGLMVPSGAQRQSAAALAAPPPLSGSGSPGSGSGGSGSASPVTVAPPMDTPTETVLDRSPGGHFVAVAEVNGMPLHFVVDTGADTVALTEADARQANVSFDPSQYRVIGRGAGGELRGQEIVIDSIVLDGKRATNVLGVVIEGADISLLGHTYLRHLQTVSIEGDQMKLR